MNKNKILPSEITSKESYLNRREVLAGMVAAGLMPLSATASLPGFSPWPNSTDAQATPKDKALSYNNFYELGSAKNQPSENAGLYQSKPWKVMVDGEVENPAEFDVDALLALAPLQERVYRLRCVEAWSMVIPWLGFPFKALIDKVQPTSDAKYVAFETFNPNDLFPDDVNSSLTWPYREGLRIDEATHDLALLAFGMYGEELLNQSGAPVRMVLPWKYGYKSIKAIVRISFVKEQPDTSWNMAQASEYGFYSNVNPDVHHPRWSQAKERAINNDIFPSKKRTLMFNGYPEVASLYSDMDLTINH